MTSKVQVSVLQFDYWMNIYKSNIALYKSYISKADRILKRLSTVRIVAFLLAVTLILVLANQRAVIWILILLPCSIVGFGLLINGYNKLRFLWQHHFFLKEINEGELDRLESKLSGFRSGKSFINRDHAYASDFDIFGAHSLFQLLNRTTTGSGEELLATWLSEPAAKNTILERQTAVKELVPMVAWRQDFQASGMHFINDKSDFGRLLGWVEKPVSLLPDRWKYLTAGIVLSVLSTLSAAYLFDRIVYVNYFNQAFSFNYILPLVSILIINYFVLKKLGPIAEEIVDSTEHNAKILGGYYALIAKIESAKFQSEKLRNLQSAFRMDHYSAAQEINKLRRVLEVFRQRGSRVTFENKFYGIFNFLWLLDIYCILITEKWKSKNSRYLREWIAAISEIEVLSSIAGFSYSNPSFGFPELAEESYMIQFTSLGHPLINENKRICNDFELKGQGEIAMITGSNMAGKSTFLRTLGVNLVLALMGAPCCAKSARISQMKIFTSMRTQDNLEEGISSFYAELNRIKQLLSLLEDGEEVFFLLDEMFKGTNSQDRYKGGVSLIHQLKALNAFGIISTHDLDLARITERKMTLANFSFNSEIRAGQIIFNYQLTEGICTDFNASELMKNSGIKILSDF
jgi:hypothetical protein